MFSGEDEDSNIVLQGVYYRYIDYKHMIKYSENKYTNMHVSKINI